MRFKLGCIINKNIFMLTFASILSVATTYNGLYVKNNDKGLGKIIEELVATKIILLLCANDIPFFMG